MLRWGWCVAGWLGRYGALDGWGAGLIGWGADGLGRGGGAWGSGDYVRRCHDCWVCRCVRVCIRAETYVSRYVCRCVDV